MADPNILIPGAGDVGAFFSEDPNCPTPTS